MKSVASYIKQRGTVCWEKLTRCFEVELKGEYYVMDPVKAVEMIDENTVLIEKVLKVEPDGVTRPRCSERAVQRTSSAHEINLPSMTTTTRRRSRTKSTTKIVQIDDENFQGHQCA
ncbi:hypothetical protein RND71_025907 [Anisodus tanguticus]|uniref:Uncharacterized protein n=1 Tax=Anisodus tanguticus TaxID=243964 RepID=A0AAE1RL65_9SOLA|nr:hypothetical protein RND71_025907 [Anisodus tanguticus]